MKRTLIGLATMGVGLAMVAAPAKAQLMGYPVYAWTSGPGITFAGDFGRGLNDESGRLSAFGGRVGVSLPIVNFWAGAATLDPGIDGIGNELTFGGGFGIAVFDPPLVPLAISLQAGAGYMNQSDPLGLGNDLSVLNIPIAVAFTFDVPSPGVNVRPWVAPRVHYLRSSLAGVSDSDFGFGASGGLSVTLPAGFGAHFAADFMSIGDPSRQPLVFGAGLHYQIPLPGLPGVPGM